MDNKKQHQQDYMAQVVERNISALVQRRRLLEERKNAEHKLADTITKFTGSMVFVFIHLVFVSGWIIWNLGWLGLKPFDPTFVVLAMIASVEAIFLSTFVLISQNRLSDEEDKRAELDLQISLLAEHEITRLIIMVKAIAEKLGIDHLQDDEIEELSKDIQPEKVMDTIDKISDKNGKNGK